MKKFITKNHSKKILILVTSILIVKILILLFMILGRMKLIYLGSEIDDQWFATQLLTTIIFFIGFVIILILHKRWKPWIIEINDKGLQIINNKNIFFIDFQNIKSVLINSSKIVTKNTTFKIPISSLENLATFLIILKEKIYQNITTKEQSQLDNRIRYEKFMLISKKFILPQFIYGFFFIIISILIIEKQLLIFKDFSLSYQIFLTDLGIIIMGIIEIIRYLDFKNKYEKTDFVITNKLVSSYVLYSIGILVWILMIILAYFLNY